MGNYSASLDKAFRALSDPTRRAVLSRLINGPVSVKELAEPFEMGLPAFLKHIKVLENSDLIASKKEGRTRTCYLKPKQLAKAEHWLGRQRALWEARTDRLAEYARSLASKESVK